MRITNAQVRSLTDQLIAKGREEARKKNNAILEKLRPKAKAEAKAAFITWKKLPKWLQDEVTYNYHKVDLAAIERAALHEMKRLNYEVRQDLFSQVMVASIECENVSQIEKKVILLKSTTVGK